jgi:hypothetical protein
MKKDVRKIIFTRLQAFVMAFALMLAWVSPVAPLMANEPEFCSMECCVAEGHCCCAERKPFVEGNLPGSDGKPVISENKITSPCPLQCTQPGYGYHHFRFQNAALVKYSGVADTSQLIYSQTPHFARDSLADESTAPRAPPSALL